MSWTQEDGGPHRRQRVPGRLGATPGAPLTVTTRIDPVATMVVSDGADTFLLRHGGGEAATVERIDPVTLESQSRSEELPGGPVWPGGMAVSGPDQLHVVFGQQPFGQQPAGRGRGPADHGGLRQRRRVQVSP